MSGDILSYTHGRGDCARSLRGDAVRHGDRMTLVRIDVRVEYYFLLRSEQSCRRYCSSKYSARRSIVDLTYMWWHPL